MAYRDFQNDGSSAKVIHSETESKASGLVVGRLQGWSLSTSHGHELLDLIEASGCDFVVVRAPAENVFLASQLQSAHFVSWQADTLLYFENGSSTLGSAASHSRLARLSPSDVIITNTLVRDIFAGYRNHYSASPALQGIDVCNAYQEWARRMLQDSNSAVYQMRDAGGARMGLCAVDTTSDAHDEVVLAGIAPAFRGRGAYSEMLQLVGEEAARRGKGSVVISSQAANIQALRAWCKLGFMPVLTLNTFHVTRRSLQIPLPQEPISSTPKAN